MSMSEGYYILTHIVFVLAVIFFRESINVMGVVVYLLLNAIYWEIERKNGKER